MKERRNYSERRQHKRASAQYIVLGIISSGEIETVGSIIDISPGGVKFTYDELRMVSSAPPISSINLIVDNYYLVDIPCEYAWNDIVETEPSSKLTNLRRCGIRFGRLSSSQIFLFKSFINRCSSHGILNMPPDLQIV